MLKSPGVANHFQTIFLLTQELFVHFVLSAQDFSEEDIWVLTYVRPRERKVGAGSCSVPVRSQRRLGSPGHRQQFWFKIKGVLKADA